jgi:adenylate cyclase
VRARQPHLIAQSPLQTLKFTGDANATLVKIYDLCKFGDMAMDVILQTVLFADISGSTRLFEQYGDQHALAQVSACMALLRGVAQAQNGRTVKTIGDEIMCVFAQPEQAAAAAIGMQEVISLDFRMLAHQIRLRIGFHHGSTIAAPGDLYGDGVNMAARMAAQAKAGQIITDRSTLARISPERLIEARLVDQTRVRGKEALFDLFEITWGQLEEMTLMCGGADQHTESTSVRPTAMTCRYQDRSTMIDSRQPVLTIGRDAVNRIVINAPMVSRLHARIELRRERFILVDQSINGTFIYPQGAPMVPLRRAEQPLPESGFIAAGQQSTPDSRLVIHFRCI